MQTLVFGKFIWYTAAAVGKHKRLLRPAPVISLPPQDIVLAGYVPQRGIANGSQPRLPYPILFTGTQNQVPASTPTFTPSGGATNSLSLLADIASRRRAEIGDANNTPQAVTDTLDQPGPYSPAMSAKVTKKILDLEFLEMSEITSEDPYLSETARPVVRPPIKDITLWVQKLSAMAASSAPATRRKPQNYLPNKPPLCGLSATSRVTTGSRTIGSTDGKHLLGRI